MKTKSIEKVIKVVSAEEDRLSLKLRSIVAQLNNLGETMSLWNGHLARAENELIILMKSGIKGSKLKYLIRQKESLSNYIFQLSGQITDLRKEFENLASQLKQEKNKKNYLKDRLKKEIDERRRNIELIQELDILEQWQLKK